MTFLPNIPQPGDLLSFSQGQLLSNNQGLDAIFGIDHYPFSNATANKGYHAVTHWPSQTPPSSNASYAQMYGNAPTANLGVIQFSSRGAASQVASPVTYLQSSLAPIVLAVNASTDILDFTGINTAICYVSVVNLNATDANSPNNNLYMVSWTGTQFLINTVYSSITGIGGAYLKVVSSGNILQVKCFIAVQNNVAWSLQFLRIT